jgi:hypothetical protein
VNKLDSRAKSSAISLPEVVQRTVLSSKTVSTRLTPEEMDEVEQAAKRDGVLRAEWMREVLLRAARKQADPPLELLLEEMIATQDVLFNYLVESARSSAANGQINPDTVLEMIQIADRKKAKNASRMIQDRQTQSVARKAVR